MSVIKLIRVLLVLAIALQITLPQSAWGQAKGGKPPTRDPAMVMFQNAADYQNNKAYELAIEEWEKLVTKFPMHTQASTAWHYLGVCNLQREEPDYQRAANAFSEALKDEKLKLREESLLNLGWALFAQARQLPQDSADRKSGLEQARQHVVDFLKSYGNSSSVDQGLLYMGDIEHLLGNRKQSIAYYKKLIESETLAKSIVRPDAMYALGVAYEEEQQFPEALRRFKDFLAEFPQHRLVGEVRLRMADMMLRDGKPQAAEELLLQIPTGKSDALADYALLRLGYALEKQGKAEQSIQQYLKLLEQFPDSPHAAAAGLSVGQAQYQAGQFDQAIPQFRKVFEAQGAQAPEAAHWMAIAILRQGKPADAIPVLERALKTADQSPMLTALKMDYADALYAIPAEIDKARAAYEALANEHSDDPLAPRAAYNAAFAALQTGKTAEARRWSEIFLTRYPQDPLRNEVAYVAAEALLRQGEHESASEAYAKLIEVDPQNPNLNLWRLRLGMARYMAGKYQAAIEGLTPALDAFQQPPQKAEAQFILGASHLYLDAPAQAIALLTASHETSDKWAAADESLLMLAEAQLRSKDNAAARQSLELLLEKYPNSRLKPQVQYKLAQLSAATGSFDAAIEAYSQIAKDQAASSFHSFARYGIVWCLMQQGQYESALEQLQPLLHQGLADAIGSEARLAEGVCLRKVGRTEEASRSLSDFLATMPSGTSLANGLYELGLAYTEQGELKKATQCFERIVNEIPEFEAMDKVLYELAWNHREGADDQLATQYFTTLAEKYPNSEFAAEANYMRAERQYDAQEYEAAAKTYTRALERTQDPSLREKGLYKLGWSLYQQELYPQAAAKFNEQALSHADGQLAVDALFMKAECAFKQDKFEDALPSYQQARDALEANPQDSAASPQVRSLIYLHAGQCLRELKRWEECESWLKVVVDRYAESPFLPVALYEMGYCKQNQDKLQEALAHYAEVAGDYRTEIAARARFMMGEVYFSQRDFKKAIPEFQRVMFGFGGEKAPDDIKNWQAQSAFEAARCSEVLLQDLQGSSRNKVLEVAKEFYQFVVQKHAAHDLAAKAQTRLGELQKLR